MMKTILSITMGCLLYATTSLASVLTVRLASDTNGQVQIELNANPVTRARLKELLTIVGTHGGKDQMVYVCVSDEDVPAASLIEIVNDIQSIGLHDLVLMSPGEQNGKKGTYRITVDATKKKFGGCIAGVEFDSGFDDTPPLQRESDQPSPIIDRALERIQKEKKTTQENSQPTNAPYSSPAPQVQKR